MSWEEFQALDHGAQVYRAFHTLRIVALERPDYVYEKPIVYGGKACLYAYQGEPSCLIGQVLHRLGLPLDRMPENEPIGRVWRDLGIERDTALLWQAAQGVQDNGGTWGIAFKAAESVWSAVSA